MSTAPRPHGSSTKRVRDVPSSVGGPPTSAPRISRYTKSEKLGAGAYGTVYKARDNETGDMVALKKVKLDGTPTCDGIPATTIREIACLRGLSSHPNVLSLLDVEHVLRDSAGRPCLHIVTSLCACDLASWLHGLDEPPSPQVLRNCFHQMLSRDELYLNVVYLT